MTTNCNSCPNFRTSTLHPSGGASLSVGACAEEGRVVFIGGRSPIGHLEELATMCPSFGQEASIEPTFFSMVEADTHKMTSFTTTPTSAVSTCRQCENFITDNDPSVPAGVSLCSVTGSAIDTEESYKGCMFASEGFPVAPAKPLNEMITSAVAISSGQGAATKVAVKAKKRAAAKVAIDPATYVSDLPVAEEDKGKIRAWRAVGVGEGKKRKEIHLPIFDPEFFDETERDLIPFTGSDEHPELYHDGKNALLETFAVESWLNDEPLCLVGEPGVGKTDGARYLAWLMQMPFTHLQVTEETLPDEFNGRTVFKEGETKFHWGRLPRGITKPCVLLSDEINTGQDSILQSYRSLLTRSGTLYLDGEEDAAKVVVKRHPYCFHLLALNPAWDPRNLGVRELSDADVSRLSFFWLNEPSDQVIADIILANLEAEGLSVTDDELAGMLKVRKDIKELAKSGALSFSWSIRQDVKVAKKMAHYSPTTAYNRALLDYCSPDSAEAVTKAVQSVFGYGD